MHSLENPIIPAVASNTPAQSQALGMRALLLEGTRFPALVARGIVFDANPGPHIATTEGSLSVLRYPLLAPYGQYQSMVEDTPYLVAVHLHESGRIEAHGPFLCDEEAYDYFPIHSSPHDTQVVVFRVSTQRRPTYPQ